MMFLCFVKCDVISGLGGEGGSESLLGPDSPGPLGESMEGRGCRPALLPHNRGLAHGASLHVST